MLVQAFRVRLKEKPEDTTFKQGIIGTVIGEDARKTPDGQVAKIYLVLWYGVNELTGEEAVIDQASPSEHISTQLLSHVDPIAWDLADEFDEDEEDDEYDDDNAIIHNASNNTNTEATI